MSYSIVAKHKELLREIALRKRFYPKWVFEQRMTQEQANEQLAIMEAIASDYAAFVESLQNDDLFAQR